MGGCSLARQRHQKDDYRETCRHGSRVVHTPVETAVSRRVFAPMPLDTMATVPESAAATGYRVGDQCFALHDGSTALYKAGSYVRGDDGAEPQFLIHYDGWNKKGRVGPCETSSPIYKRE